jgi:phosphatidate cytidylyltransferase
MMLAALFGLLLFDYRVQDWTRSAEDPNGVAGIGVLALLLLLCPLATYELATLFAAEKVKPYRVIAGAGSTLLLIHGFLTQFKFFQPIAASTLAFIVVFVMLFAALQRASKKQTHEAITHMAGTILATMYIGGLSWFLVALRVKSSGHYVGSTAVVLMILLCVKCTDIGAYFGGRAFGKRKLIPWLSPGKTWEGLGFGILTAGLIGALMARWIHAPEYHMLWWKGFIFGAVIGGVGQAGDLLESLMKRDAEVKDSGALIPGFGGLLDVMDSPLLAAPFAYLLFSLL